MQKEKITGFFRNKGTLGVLTLMLVGITAFATYRAGYDSTEQKAQDLAVQKEQETETAAQEGLEAAGQDVLAQLENSPQPETVQETETEKSVDVSASTVQAIIQPTVNFQDDSMLTWPAAGRVLMDYNMDSTVYFKTLNQYKYNPAMIISSPVGNQVVASAKGIVESITVDEETGTTLKLNLGNDYKLIYGQLKELAVSEGQVVEQGQLLGYVSEPTKYYVEEGSNLYFRMEKDGKAVDPYLYLE